MPFQVPVPVVKRKYLVFIMGSKIYVVGLLAEDDNFFVTRVICNIYAYIKNLSLQLATWPKTNKKGL